MPKVDKVALLEKLQARLDDERTKNQAVIDKAKAEHEAAVKKADEEWEARMVNYRAAVKVWKDTALAEFKTALKNFNEDADYPRLDVSSPPNRPQRAHVPGRQYYRRNDDPEELIKTLETAIDRIGLMTPAKDGSINLGVKDVIWRYGLYLDQTNPWTNGNQYRY